MGSASMTRTWVGCPASSWKAQGASTGAMKSRAAAVSPGAPVRRSRGVGSYVYPWPQESPSARLRAPAKSAIMMKTTTHAVP
jgi:hypothetical protein